MIVSFSDKDTESIFDEKTPSKKCKLPKQLYSKTLTKLRMLDQAQELRDLATPPSNRLEKLLGDRKNQYSIRINDRWRLCFGFENGEARDVELTDHYK